MTHRSIRAEPIAEVLLATRVGQKYVSDGPESNSHDRREIKFKIEYSLFKENVQKFEMYGVSLLSPFSFKPKLVIIFFMKQSIKRLCV